MSEPKRDEMAEETAVAEETAPAEGEGLDALAEDGETDALRAERDELKDRLLRAMADAENVRKRGERDRREAEIYGGTKLARDLLPVYDNLNRALAAMDEAERETAKSVVEGVELTLRELVNAFAKHGIEPVSPQVGDPFDPQLHQAMFEAPVPSVKQGNIVQVMVEGFTIHDRLLRPAQVGVSSTPAGQENEGSESEDG
ncbi:nucleotide exchange factor GrpE [Rhodovulum sp. YNF3179]|uniref:nucleotide exchange factor GrpE n=1 Tax=Rhodovulum sp. YNF3179 TaxID=3425127 RepID=UPI003D33AE46